MEHHRVIARMRASAQRTHTRTTARLVKRVYSGPKRTIGPGSPGVFDSLAGRPGVFTLPVSQAAIEVLVNLPLKSVTSTLFAFYPLDEHESIFKMVMQRLWPGIARLQAPYLSWREQFNGVVTMCALYRNMFALFFFLFFDVDENNHDEKEETFKFVDDDDITTRELLESSSVKQIASMTSEVYDDFVCERALSYISVTYGMSVDGDQEHLDFPVLSTTMKTSKRSAILEAGDEFIPDIRLENYPQVQPQAIADVLELTELRGEKISHGVLTYIVNVEAHRPPAVAPNYVAAVRFRVTFSPEKLNDASMLELYRFINSYSM